jgi:uncharacterized Zn-binding protein involved in type VI secretion
MPAAARITDQSNHPGVVSGTGVTSVLISGRPAAVLGTVHTCFRPTNSGTDPATPIVSGSTSVLFGGKPAARVGDSIGCGAMIARGDDSVQIGG